MIDTLFEAVGFVCEYRQQFENFYKPYFVSAEELNGFFVNVFQNDDIDKTPRRMMNQIQQFVSLSNDIDKIRPARDPLRVLFLRTCLEALYKLNQKSSASKHDIKDFFKEYISKEGQKYILEHFQFSWLEPDYEMDEKAKMLFDRHGRYSLTIDDFAMIFYKIRGMVVHEGDYWSMQLFSRDDDSIWMVHLSTDEQMINCYQRQKGKPVIYHFQTTLNYEKFIFYFVKGCIQYLCEYITENK